MNSLENVEANISEMPHITEVIARTSADDQLFKELYEVLKRHDADHRFGVTLIHKHYEVAPDEILMEYTDEEARIQTIKVEKIADVEMNGTIETSWSLKDGKVQMSCRCIKQDQHNHTHNP
jgi:phosphopentomutase